MAPQMSGTSIPAWRVRGASRGFVMGAAVLVVVRGSGLYGRARLRRACCDRGPARAGLDASSSHSPRRQPPARGHAGDDVAFRVPDLRDDVVVDLPRDLGDLPAALGHEPATRLLQVLGREA